MEFSLKYDARTAERLLVVNYYHKTLHLRCCSSPRSATACAVSILEDMGSSHNEELNKKCKNI